MATNIVGRKFGRLTVIARRGINSSNHALWKCRCECGKSTIVCGTDLKRGNSRSCGCLPKRGGCGRGRVPPEGKERANERECWKSMKARCLNPNSTGFNKYGGAGVRVCAKWIRSFAAFMRDVGPRPSARHSLDRYPKRDGDYKPGNVRWATASEQARNMRTNRLVTHNGITKTLVEWAEEKGIKYHTLYNRLVIRHISPERAFV